MTASVVEGARLGDASTLFPVAFDLDTRFGRCIGLDLAPASAAARDDLPSLLHAEERALCQGMRGARLVEFVGGRVAARLARTGMPGAGRPALRGVGGMPALVGGSIGLSISHTRHLAVALARPGPGSVGVDIELEREDDGDALLAERILSDEERSADARGEPVPLVRRLSLKEAAYKALFPHVGPRSLRCLHVFHARSAGPGYEVAVDGGATIAVECREIRGHVLSLASLRWDRAFTPEPRE